MPVYSFDTHLFKAEIPTQVAEGGVPDNEIATRRSFDVSVKFRCHSLECCRKTPGILAIRIGVQGIELCKRFGNGCRLFGRAQGRKPDVRIDSAVAVTVFPKPTAQLDEP